MTEQASSECTDSTAHLLLRGLKLRARGADVEAAGCFALAVSRERGPGESLETGLAWFALGQIQLAQGGPTAAVESFRCAVVYAAQEASSLIGAHAWMCQGEALLCSGRPRSAMPPLRKSLVVFEQCGGDRGAGFACCLLGEALAEIGESEGADASFRQAVSIARRHNLVGLEVRACLDRARTSYRRHHFERASSEARAVRQLAVSIRDPESIGWATLVYAECCFECGRFGSAWWWWRKAALLFRRSACSEGLEIARSRCERLPFWLALKLFLVVWVRAQRRLPPSDP